MNHTGRKRVIISNLSPLIEGGVFPAKLVVNEPLVISADIFIDGHDEIDAVVRVRSQGDKDWKEVRMQYIINDHWEAELELEETGFYEFNVFAWADHFSTWKKGLQKKFDAGQNIEVELLIGAELMEEAAGRAQAKDKKSLLKNGESIRKSKDAETGLLLAMQQEPSDLMFTYRDQDLVSSSAIGRVEVERKKAAFSTWYELFPRSASPVPGQHGTFKDVQQLLPGIAAMGFDVLYFPPIHPIGEVNRKGKNNSLSPTESDPGSPWAIGNRKGGHKAIHPQLGKLKDFKELVKEAKKLNIEIALDIAYQCAPDHPYVKAHPQWFKWRPDGSVQYAENPPKKYEDILPINFETEDWENLWQELKSTVDYWIEQGVHIFRIDNPHTKAFAFWEWMIKTVRAQHPEVIFLAEAFTRPRMMERLAKAGFNQSYTYFTWRNSKKEIVDYMTELTKTEMRYYFRPNFWPNTPDILPDHLVRGGENAHITRLILAATLSSSYGLYGPVYEFGMNLPHPGKEEYTDNEKYEIKNWDWGSYTRTKEIISRVNRIRRNHAALQSTWNINFIETNNDQIICYAKIDKKNNDRMIVVVNLDNFNTQGAYLRVPLEVLNLDPYRSYWLHDLLSGNKYEWREEWNYVELNPYEMPAHIFTLKQD